MVDCWEEKWNKGVLPTWRADTRVVATQFVASLPLSRLFSAISQEDHCPQFAIPLSLSRLFFSGFRCCRRSKNFFPPTPILHSHTMQALQWIIIIGHNFWQRAMQRLKQLPVQNSAGSKTSTMLSCFYDILLLNDG